MSSNKPTLTNNNAVSEQGADNNNSRRRVLKKAGVATSVVAASAWVKPSLNSVILPAHAQTSMVVMMGGATATDPSASINQSRFENIANKALDAVIPQAHAGADPSFNGDICNAFVQNGADDNTHCVSLELDQAADNAGFTLTLTGPMIYYNLCYGEFAGSVYYEGKRSFAGMTTGNLDGKDLTVSMGDLNFEGTVDDSFTSASGVLFINTRLASSSIGSSYGGNRSFCSPGYGAYWETSSEGMACVAGSGINSSRTVYTDSNRCEVR